MLLQYDSCAPKVTIFEQTQHYSFFNFKNIYKCTPKRLKLTNTIKGLKIADSHRHAQEVKRKETEETQFR